MFTSVLRFETAACPRDGWRPAGIFDPTLFLRVSGRDVEAVGAYELPDGEYGVAHGRIMFNRDIPGAYMSSLAKAAFSDEAYWRRCLLPERFGSLDEAVERLHQMTGG